MSEISEMLTTIPDVEKALVMTKEGTIIGDTSYEASFAGAHGQFLALFCDKIGALLGLGEQKSSAVQGIHHHLLLSVSKHHHLCVTAKGSSQSSSVESEIRRVLAQK